MYKRKRMSRKASKRNFKRNAACCHKKNLRAAPMRGGIRL